MDGGDAADANEAEGGDDVERDAARDADAVGEHGVRGPAGAREADHVDARALGRAVAEQRELELDEPVLRVRAARRDGNGDGVVGALGAVMTVGALGAVRPVGSVRSVGALGAVGPAGALGAVRPVAITTPMASAATGAVGAVGTTSANGSGDDGDAEWQKEHARRGERERARVSGADAHCSARVRREHVLVVRPAADVRVAQRARHEGARALRRVRAHGRQAAGEPAPGGARPPDPVAQDEHAEEAVGLAEDAQARGHGRRAAHGARDRVRLGVHAAREARETRVAVDAARVAVDAGLVRQAGRVAAVVGLGADDAAEDLAELVGREGQVGPLGAALVEGLEDGAGHFYNSSVSPSSSTTARFLFLIGVFAIIVWYFVLCK